MSYFPKRMVRMRNVEGGAVKPDGVAGIVEGVCGIAPGVEGTGERAGIDEGMVMCWIA